MIATAQNTAPELPEEAEGFHVTDEASANWVLRKLANLEAEKARVKAQADALMRSLEADAEGLRFRFGAELEAFARQQIEATGNRRKSVTLLQGTLAFRTVPAAVRLADDRAALDHATAIGLSEAIRPTLDADAYRAYAEKHLETTGELIPGFEQTDARESFSIRFGK